MSAVKQTPAPAAKLDEREPFGAFVGDEGSLRVLRTIATEYGWVERRVQKGTAETAVRMIGIVAPPKVLVVDISAAKDPLAEARGLIDAVGRDTHVIALGATNDVELYRKLTGAGVLDYLLKPLTREAASAAISKALMSVQGGPKGAASPAGPGKMALVIGVRGGLGSSMLATNLAWLVANEMQRPTALLDLDLNFGTSALTFDLEPGRGLADALEDPTRIDELFIERAIVSAGENLSILGSEMPVEEHFLPDPVALSQLVKVMKGKAAVLVIDLPRQLVGRLSSLLEEASDILVVTEQTLAATRDTIRLLGFIKNAAPQTKVAVIVNNVRNPGGEEVAMGDFETSIEKKVGWILPQDPKNVLEAVRKGKVLPQVAHDAKLVQTIRQMAQEVTGLAPQKPAKGKWFARGK
jgi:pilus assembly protein CpaE